jgi:hypothetical protein
VSVIIEEDDAVPSAGDEGSEGSKEVADAYGTKSHDNSAAEPVYNPYQDELDKDNGAIPCAFCALSFPDEDEVISHMIAVYPRMSG